MKVNRKQVDNILVDVMPKFFAIKDKMMDTVTKKLLEINFPIGIIEGLLINSYPAEDLIDVAAGAVMKALYETALLNDVGDFDYQELNIEKYFTDAEIVKINQFKIEEEDEDDTERLIFDDVTVMGDGHFLCSKVDWSYLVEKYHRGLIRYNIRTQRELTTRVDRKGNIIKKITINPKSVKEITQKMIEGKFIPNTISLNIRNITGEEEIEYNKEIRQLRIKISKKTIADLIDGMHRTMAAIRAVKKNPNIVTSLNIFYYSEDQAHDYITQEDKGNPIADETIALYNTESIGLQITKLINKKGNKNANKLFNRIAESRDYLGTKNTIVDQLTIANSVDNWFISSDKGYVKTKVVSYLTEFLNSFIENYEADFDNIKDKKTQDTVNNMFVGLIALAEKLYNTDWQESVLYIFEKYSFNELLELSNSMEKLTKKYNNELAHRFRKLITNEGGVI